MDDPLKFLDEALYLGKKAEIMLASQFKNDPQQCYPYQKYIQLFLAQVGKAKEALESTLKRSYRSDRTLPSQIDGSFSSIIDTMVKAFQKIQEAKAIVLISHITDTRFVACIAKAKEYFEQFLALEDQLSAA